MTQIEVAKKLFASLEKGTVLTKSKYEEISRNFYTRDNYKRIVGCPSRWDLIIQNPEKYGVERMEVFHKVPTSKVTTENADRHDRRYFGNGADSRCAGGLRSVVLPPAKIP